MFCVETVDIDNGVEQRNLFGPFRAEASAADFARQFDGGERRVASCL